MKTFAIVEWCGKDWLVLELVNGMAQLCNKHGGKYWVAVEKITAVRPSYPIPK